MESLHSTASLKNSHAQVIVRIYATGKKKWNKTKKLQLFYLSFILEKLDPITHWRHWGQKANTNTNMNLVFVLSNYLRHEDCFPVSPYQLWDPG